MADADIFEACVNWEEQAIQAGHKEGLRCFGPADVQGRHGILFAEEQKLYHAGRATDRNYLLQIATTKW